MNQKVYPLTQWGFQYYFGLLQQESTVPTKKTTRAPRTPLSTHGVPATVLHLLHGGTSRARP